MTAAELSGRVYVVSDRTEIDRRRHQLPGALIEAWPDLHVGDLFWLEDDETRRHTYAAPHRDRPPGGLLWIGETTKTALEAVGEPLSWHLAVAEAAVPIYYGRHLTDAESLPGEDSVRARLLSAHAIAALWATYDHLGVRAEPEPRSPFDPSFYLRRPGGKTVHLFRALRTKAEALTVMSARASHEPEALDWVEQLPSVDFADLVQRHGCVSS